MEVKWRLSGPTEGCSEGGIPVSDRLQQLYKSSKEFGFNLFSQSAVFDVCWFHKAWVKLKIVIFIKSLFLEMECLKTYSKTALKIN